MQTMARLSSPVLVAAMVSMLLLLLTLEALAFVVVPPLHPPAVSRRATAAAAADDSSSNGGGVGPLQAIDMDALGEDLYDGSRPPPLIVTIGPQCGGKTSLLRRLNATRPAGAPALLDVAIDDDRDVYRRVPMRAFLQGELAGPRDVRIRGRLASERCRDPGPEECRLVLGYLAGLWPLQEAEQGLAALASTAPVLPALLASLPRAAAAFQESVQAKKAAARGGSAHPSSSDRGSDDDELDPIHAMGARCYALFVPEAIPRAVARSNQRLSAALRDHPGPVAWGNTNAKAADFKGALRAAEAYGRRAALLRWGVELERVPLEELLVRNVLRATRLGRYIPAVSIKNALDRSEGLLARSGGGETRALLTMAGFTADAQGRPRSNVPPPEEAEPLIRPFAAGVGRRLMERWASAGRRPRRLQPEPAGVCTTDTAAWGGRTGRRCSVGGPLRPPTPLLEEGDHDRGRRVGRQWQVWDADGAESFILATGGVVGTVVGSSSSSSSQAATRALFVGGVRQLNNALEQLQRAWTAAAAVGPVLVLRMGEWSKFKYWSKAASDMDWEWRRDYQRARNQTLKDREEMMRLNGTDPWAAKDRMFDFELWTIVRTLTGQNNNNRF